jgi:hypothetical protein
MSKRILGFILLLGLSSTSWSQQPPDPDVPEPGNHGSDAPTRRYTGHEEQFVLNIPEDWFAYDQTAQIKGSASAVGMVIFSSADLSKIMIRTPDSGISLEEQIDAGVKLDRGEIPNFFVDRVPAARGSDCNGFSKKAVKNILRMLRGDPMWTQGWVVDDDLSLVETMTIGGCEGLHFHGRSRSPEGTQRVMDVRAVSDGEVVYLFSVRASQPYFDVNSPVYEAAVASVNLSAYQ